MSDIKRQYPDNVKRHAGEHKAFSIVQTWHKAPTWFDAVTWLVVAGAALWMALR